jgi:hypothetical protein
MRKPTLQTELEWRRPDEVRWADLPPEVRERAREWLALLLRQGARRGRPAHEAPDET